MKELQTRSVDYYLKLNSVMLGSKRCPTIKDRYREYRVFLGVTIIKI